MPDAIDPSLLLDPEHRRTRRRIAVVAFAASTVVGVGLLSIGMLDDKAAARVVQMSGLVTTWFGMNAAIIAGYFGAGAWEQVTHLRQP